MNHEKLEERITVLTLPRWVLRYITVMAMQESADQHVCTSALLTAMVDRCYDELKLEHDCRISDLWGALRNHDK